LTISGAIKTAEEISLSFLYPRDLLLVSPEYLEGLIFSATIPKAKPKKTRFSERQKLSVFVSHHYFVSFFLKKKIGCSVISKMF